MNTFNHSKQVREIWLPLPPWPEPPGVTKQSQHLVQRARQYMLSTAQQRGKTLCPSLSYTYLEEGAPFPSYKVLVPSLAWPLWGCLSPEGPHFPDNHEVVV